MAPFSLPEARRFPFRMFVLDKRGDWLELSTDYVFHFEEYYHGP